MQNILVPKEKPAEGHYFDIISPDGISISRTNKYFSRKEVEIAFREWRNRFVQQGYYSSNEGRIELDQLHIHCKVEEFKDHEETNQEWLED